MSGGPGIFLNRMAVIARNLLEDARGGLQVLDPVGKYFVHLVQMFREPLVLPKPIILVQRVRIAKIMRDPAGASSR